VWDLEGKLLRLYADKEKKSIGWSVLEQKENFANLEGMRLVKVNTNGVAVFGIGKLLKAIGVELKESRKGLEVKTFKGSLYPNPIHYIQL